MEREEHSKYLIGYYFPTKKLSKTPSFLDFIKLTEKSDRVKLQLIDPLKTIESQGKFDLILYKLNSELNQTDERSKKTVELFENYFKSNKNVINIDPVDGQRKALDRNLMGSLLKQAEVLIPKELNVCNPSQKVFESEESTYDVSSLRFPVICKTVQAGGSAESHKMGVVFNEKGLHKFSPPMIVQEFYNHNATIFKVFVVGNFIHSVKRPSIPNLPIQSDAEPIMFDSQVPFSSQIPSESINDQQNQEDVQLPPEETLRSLSKSIQETFGLSLFGFDVIKHAETGKYACIDINYFPGYIGVPNFEHELLNYLLSRLQHKK